MYASNEYLLDCIPEFIIRVTGDYDVLWMNRLAKESSQSDDTSISMKCHKLLFSSIEPCLNCPLTVLKGEVKSVKMTATTVDNTGKPIFIETSATVTDDYVNDFQAEDAECKSYVCMCRNITQDIKEKIKLESQLSAIARAGNFSDANKVTQLLTRMEKGVGKNYDIKDVYASLNISTRNECDGLLRFIKDIRDQSEGIEGMINLLKVSALEGNAAEYIKLLERSSGNIGRLIDAVEKSILAKEVYESDKALLKNDEKIKSVRTASKGSPVGNISLASRISVLVADRDVNSRIAMKSALKRDYNLYFARTGKEALDTYMQVSPDVFIVDILLPEIDGFDILDEINNCKKKRGMIIAMTEMIVNTEPEYLLKYGFDDYISKPVNPDVLRNIIDGSLNRYGIIYRGKRI